MGGIGMGWPFTLLGSGVARLGVSYCVNRWWETGWRTALEGHEVIDRADEEREAEKVKWM